MPIFILLSTLTQQGVTTLKSNPERLREVNRDVEELGCRVLHQWAVLGALVSRFSKYCISAPGGAVQSCTVPVGSWAGGVNIVRS